jgi:hypothetical protein
MASHNALIKDWWKRDFALRPSHTLLHRSRIGRIRHCRDIRLCNWNSARLRPRLAAASSPPPTTGSGAFAKPGRRGLSAPSPALLSASEHGAPAGSNSNRGRWIRWEGYACLRPKRNASDLRKICNLPVKGRPQIQNVPGRGPLFQDQRNHPERGGNNAPPHPHRRDKER